MGAVTFEQRAEGKDAKQAFAKARDAAAWEHGHGGYTGTIAEKREFVMIDPKTEGEKTDDWSQIDYENYARELAGSGDPRVDDKWGPAGCIQLSDREFLFFGWASS